MSNIINLLPDAVADKIAAGEVISRPAAAVKELLENSIDANATTIHLVLKHAGKELIKVVDNGAGMSPIDARMCFARHATSKIKNADDLFNLSTKGFRGEALASIASIAQVELRTKQANDELGTLIRIEGSEVIEQEPCQCATGTHFTIKNLFYNVPARRKFLKSEQVEMRHVLDEFQRVVLAHPDISFTLTHNDKEVYHLTQGNLKQRIVALMGKKYLSEIIVVEEDTTSLSIKGYVGKPEVARKTRGQQFFFVNNRYIKHHYLQHAVKTCFEGLMNDELVPFFVLFLDIDPSKIDVNVHPSKQEIKFEDEQLVYKLLKSVIQRALGSHNVTPTIDFDQEAILDGGAWLANIPQTDEEKGSPNYNPFNNSGKKQQQVLQMFQNDFKGTTPQNDDWQNALKTVDFPEEPSENISTITIASSSSNKQNTTENSGSLFPDNKQDAQPFQVHNKYIFYQIKTGILLVDQQAALERILFERYKTQFEHDQPGAQQTQMFPETMRLPADDSHILRSVLSDIRILGYIIEEVDENTFSIEGVPTDMNINDHRSVIETLLEQYKISATSKDSDYRSSFFRELARQNALKAEKQLSVEEMRNLVDKLFGCSMSYISPSGQSTYTRLSLTDIASLFK
ncbi:UNVERIFIED_CONTAM: hypothetical protein GTU68_006075 [Idotea baltica]|nr:hypothetical protein [Idotea baltica]